MSVIRRFGETEEADLVHKSVWLTNGVNLLWTVYYFLNTGFMAQIWPQAERNHDLKQILESTARAGAAGAKQSRGFIDNQFKLLVCCIAQGRRLQF